MELALPFTDLAFNHEASDFDTIPNGKERSFWR
jgi:hypothetical protein